MKVKIVKSQVCPPRYKLVSGNAAYWAVKTVKSKEFAKTVNFNRVILAFLEKNLSNVLTFYFWWFYKL